MNVSFEEAAVEDVVEEEVVDIGLKTRKRKHQGLGISKPPKKKPRLPVPLVQPSVPTSSSSAPRKQVRKKTASASCTTLAGPSSDPAPPPTSAPTGSTVQPPAVSVKPVPRKCKKKLGVCNHEIVFENHYNHKERNIYVNSVRLAKSVLMQAYILILSKYNYLQLSFLPCFHDYNTWVMNTGIPTVAARTLH